MAPTEVIDKMEDLSGEESEVRGDSDPELSPQVHNSVTSASARKNKDEREHGFVDHRETAIKRQLSLISRTSNAMIMGNSHLPPDETPRRRPIVPSHNFTNFLRITQSSLDGEIQPRLGSKQKAKGVDSD